MYAITFYLASMCSIHKKKSTPAYMFSFVGPNNASDKLPSKTFYIESHRDVLYYLATTINDENASVARACYYLFCYAADDTNEHVEGVVMDAPLRTLRAAYPDVSLIYLAHIQDATITTPVSLADTISCCHIRLAKKGSDAAL